MSADPVRVFRVRRGRVRFKSGCELHVLPSLRERHTQAAHAWLSHSVEKAKDAFADDLAGFVLIPWDSQGDYRVFLRVYGGSVGLNTLPVWVAEAIRRRIADEDTCRLLDLPEPA